MKLLIKYEYNDDQGNLKKKTKTFSGVVEGLSNEQYKDFALAVIDLMVLDSFKIYTVTENQIQ